MKISTINKKDYVEIKENWYVRLDAALRAVGQSRDWLAAADLGDAIPSGDYANVYDALAYGTPSDAQGVYYRLEARDVPAYRFGALPLGGRSRNYADDGKLEAGVSLASVGGGKEWSGAVWWSGVRKTYLVCDVLEVRGSDGEQLGVNCRRVSYRDYRAALAAYRAARKNGTVPAVVDAYASLEY